MAKICRHEYIDQHIFPVLPTPATQFLYTGPGFSAFVLAQLFPEAEVIAVDLAAPYVRMARKWQSWRNITNINFYHANAEDMAWLESETFDLINFAYVMIF